MALHPHILEKVNQSYQIENNKYHQKLKIKFSQLNIGHSELPDWNMSHLELPIGYTK